MAASATGIKRYLDAFWLGSHRYLEERGQETPEVHTLLELETRSTAGQSVVLVGDETHVCGLITLADTVRPGVADTLRALHAAGVKHIAMLTGDNAGTAKAIAAETADRRGARRAAPGRQGAHHRRPWSRSTSEWP